MSIADAHATIAELEECGIAIDYYIGGKAEDSIELTIKVDQSKLHRLDSGCEPCERVSWVSISDATTNTWTIVHVENGMAEMVWANSLEQARRYVIDFKLDNVGSADSKGRSKEDFSINISELIGAAK
ncbi:hypothetical protein [Pseudidiomarina aquimaris]|nr:hypothetical protein [Pseudidiomarina aquimaris]